jgi:single-stranded-DNA-specific exonuclease
LRDVLDQVATQHPGLLTKFGGHAMAAGLSLAKDDLDRFKRALNDSVAEALGHIPPERTEESDGTLTPGDFGLVLAEQLASGGPWGQHFPEPLFDGQFAVRSHRIVGEKHLKLTLEVGGTEIEGIAFNIDVPEWLAAPLDVFNALYRLDVNEYRGERRAQLVIQSFWPC